MTSKIKSEQMHPLLKRKEIKLEIDHSKKPTPSTQEMLKEVSEKTKVDVKLISVKKIKNNFGNFTAEITAHIYEDEKSKDEIEKINKKKARLEDLKKQHAEKKAEKVKEEKPQEAGKSEE
ncbi:MAG: DUF151 domain-containing protein [Nanoarchaeota archaeon]|nr:DUF151 domain-containing protein [Nanoarchaeota archaeon]